MVRVADIREKVVPSSKGFAISAPEYRATSHGARERRLSPFCGCNDATSQTAPPPLRSVMLQKRSGIGWVA